MAVIGIMFNLKGEPPDDGEPPDSHAELDSESTVNAVAEALKAYGHDVCLIEGNDTAYLKLRSRHLDIVFNMCEGVRGESRESHIPAILEMLGIPYTGSGPLALALTLDKPLAKKVLSYHEIPTPRFKVFDPEALLDGRGLTFPVFVKPAHEGSSMGIASSCHCDNLAELRAEVKRLTGLYHEPVLVEEYLPGEEFTVGILGNKKPVLFPVMQINFDAIPEEHGRIYSRRFKTDWSEDIYYLCPAPVSSELEKQLKDTALRTYRVLGCRDLSRVDLRLDRNGVPNVLEVNPLPGMTPGFSDYPRIAEKGGWSYGELVNGILETALRRQNLTHLSAPAFQRQIAD
jgi:D-alanine-D-alanine ligase